MQRGKLEIDTNINSNVQNKKNAISFDINFTDSKKTTSNNVKKPNPRTEVIPNVEDPEDEKKDEPRYECPNCGRKFKREAYRKHVPICQRVFQGKKDVEIPKNPNIEDSKDKNSKIEKPLGKKSKWENQSSELRAIIQSKRAEKEQNKIINEPIIEIEEGKKIPQNIMKMAGPSNINTKQSYVRGEQQYVSCNLCNKKFTRINYDSHLPECERKYKDKQGNKGFNAKPTFSMGSMNNRQPTMPAVQYGAFSNRPNMKFKF